MKLNKIIVSGFRSIKGTEEILLDNNVNILIVANDHGKSNILAAIQHLNPKTSILDDERNWDLSDTGAVRIQWHFSVDPKNLEQFAYNEPVKKGETDPSTDEQPQPINL